MRYLIDLSIDELQQLKNNGHIGEETKNIVELEQFFKDVENVLNKKEEAVKRELPVNKTFAVLTTSHSFVFKTLNFIDIPDTKYISYYINLQMVDINSGRKYEGIPGFDGFELGYNEKIGKIVFVNIETGDICDVNEIPEEVFNNLYNK